MNRRTFLGLAGTAGAGVAAFGGYAHWIEPFWLDVTRRVMPIPRLPQSLEGSTLLHVSDLHIGPLVDDRYLERVWRTGTALQPDLVAYTGDWVTWRGTAQLQQLESHLVAAPRGRIATWSVLGNHDYGERWRELRVASSVAERVTQSGIRLLRNESLDLDGMLVAGIDDLWSRLARPQKALASWRAGTPALVLNHNPDCLDDRAAWRGYDGWVLSGHTHGGQCRSPFLDPPLLPVRNRRYTSGEIAVGDGRRVYISRGVGYTLQVRVNVRPEITLFTLHRA
ncbi:MAG TPA: metallophosphoesterase [Gemmatimonadaceae bacterium]|nr:metallophosphoesterase [Gemmatimonadaceae bacterium]